MAYIRIAYNNLAAFNKIRLLVCILQFKQFTL